MNSDETTKKDSLFIKNEKLNLKGIAIFALLFGGGAFVVGQIDKSLSVYSWSSDGKQTSTENPDVTTDFFWNKGESLQRFLVKSKQCTASTDWVDMKVKVSSSTYNYRYACNDDGYAIIAGKGFEEIAITMYAFELAEKYGEDVDVILWDKTYTFDAAGYMQAYKDSTAYFRSL